MTPLPTLRLLVALGFVPISPVYKKSGVGQRGRQLRRQRFEELPVVVKRATDVVRKLDNAHVAVRQTQHKQCFLARDFRGSNDVARGGIKERGRIVLEPN